MANTLKSTCLSSKQDTYYVDTKELVHSTNKLPNKSENRT